MKCNQCKELKLLTEYPKDKAVKWDVKKICKTCQNKKANNRLYARQAQGICSRCPEPAIENKNYCQKCSDSMYEQKKLKAKQDYINGVCKDCSYLREQGNSYCNECQVKRKVRDQGYVSRRIRYSKKYYEERFLLKVCRSCTNRLEDATKTKCHKCREAEKIRNLAKRHERFLKKECVECAISMTEQEHSFKTCNDCRKKRSKNKRDIGQRHHHTGNCYSCGQPRTVSKNGELEYYCEYHKIYYRALSSNAQRSTVDGSKLDFEVIQKVHYGAWSHTFESYVCGYTGFISPHLYDFEMDHIDPLSKGGSHKLSNIVLCESGFNARKGSKTVCVIEGVEISYRDLLRTTRFWVERIGEGYSYDPTKRDDVIQIVSTVAARLTDNPNEVGIHGKNQLGS